MSLKFKPQELEVSKAVERWHRISHGLRGVLEGALRSIII